MNAAGHTLKGAFSRLARRIEGEVHTDELRRYMLSTDASIFRKMPAAVVYPRSTRDVRAVVRFAAARQICVHSRGAGSGLCGAAVGDGIVLDFSKYMHCLVRLDISAPTFECQPGYRLGELDEALAGTGLFFPPDPSSGEYATFGGMCNTNASGAHAVKYGNVADYLLDAQVVLGDGTIGWLSHWQAAAVDDLPENLRRLAALYQAHAQRIEKAYPPVACNVAGYNLRGLVRDGHLCLHRLLAGSEGTLAVVTQLKFRLLPRPGADALVVAYFDGIGHAARAVQLALPLGPSGIECMDKSLLDLARISDRALKGRLPTGVDNVLLMEFDGPSLQDCAKPAERILRLLRANNLTDRACLAVTAEEKRAFWALRKAAVPILYRLKGRKKIVALVEDAAVPVERLASYFEGIYEILRRHGVEFVLYGHIAKGLMHTRPLLDLKKSCDVDMLRPIADDVYELVERLGGTVSGEHGDGRLRSAYIQRRYPTIYTLFEQVKALLDPGLIFNPEIKKSVDPGQMARDLRFGGQYQAHSLATPLLAWPETLEAEAEKCHGCSKCTTITADTRMCPVYKATRDEAAAPKAKANLLRALISGAMGPETLFQAGLRHVMDQCVNCGSCALECPSKVNIPKLAMEAKAHNIRRRGAALADRLSAHVELVAGTTRKLTPLIAAARDLPGFWSWTARLTGLAPQREMVLFARRSLYRQWPEYTPGRGPAILFYAGCYAAYMRPQLGVAACDVLAHMGFQVHLPRQACCGLPLFSKGLVAEARRKVGQNLRAWRELLGRVEHIVVTCSSCGFALMEDWRALMDDAALARRIASKTVHISHLLNLYRQRLTLDAVPLKLAYHQPCHLRIQPQAASSLALLADIPGLELKDLKSHCCGMAGSWGLLAKNYALSRAIGTPMIAKLNSSGAVLAVTDCPTCQMQIEHLSRLPVKHPIEIIRQALPGV